MGSLLKKYEEVLKKNAQRISKLRIWKVGILDLESEEVIMRGT